MRVRWYRVPSDTPPLPFPHCFEDPLQLDLESGAIRDLDDEECGVEDQKVAAHNGAPPPWAPGTHGPCGSAEAWLHGAARGVDPPLTWRRDFRSTCCAEDAVVGTASKIPKFSADGNAIQDSRLTDTGSGCVTSSACIDAPALKIAGVDLTDIFPSASGTTSGSIPRIAGAGVAFVDSRISDDPLLDGPEISAPLTVTDALFVDTLGATFAPALFGTVITTGIPAALVVVYDPDTGTARGSVNVTASPSQVTLDLAGQGGITDVAFALGGTRGFTGTEAGMQFKGGLRTGGTLSVSASDVAGLGSAALADAADFQPARSHGTLAAAGSMQSDAAPIVTSNVSVTGADGTKGVLLPDEDGALIPVENAGGSILRVYPPVGQKISGGATDAPYSQLGTSTEVFVRVSATQWRHQTYL